MEWLGHTLCVASKCTIGSCSRCDRACGPANGACDKPGGKVNFERVRAWCVAS